MKTVQINYTTDKIPLQTENNSKDAHTYMHMYTYTYKHTQDLVHDSVIDVKKWRTQTIFCAGCLISPRF